MKKKLIITISLLLSLLLILTSVNSIGIAYGANSSNVSMDQINMEATNLNKLGLLAGTNKGFALEEIPTRLQGIIMLVRLMGEEEAAQNCTYTHPFTDVPAWGDRYVAWAYAKKYTAGTSATTFSSTENMTAQQYIAFTLRALGYGNDTVYKNTIADAVRFGLIPEGAYKDAKTPFLRADMVHVTYLAMMTKEKTTGLDFYMYLIAKGAIDQDTALLMFFNQEQANNTTEKHPDKTGNQSNEDIDHMVDFLTGGNSGSQGGGPSNTPEKLYSLTNTNNKKSSYTVSVKGDVIVVKGYERDGLSLHVNIYEIKTEDTSSKFGEKEMVLHEEIIRPDGSFSETINIPSLQYGHYFELNIDASGKKTASAVMEKIWVKKDSDGWYIEGPTKINSNNTLMQAADSRPLDVWNSKRENVTEDFKRQIMSLMGSPKNTDYDTAYNVHLWITQNITPASNLEVDSISVLKNRKANCEGYSNLMVDALAVYDIPARVVIGETIFGTPASFFNNSSSYANHAWVEFYDSSLDQWVVCNPAAGTGVSSGCFDLNRTYTAMGLKVVQYR